MLLMTGEQLKYKQIILDSDTRRRRKKPFWGLFCWLSFTVFLTLTNIEDILGQNCQGREHHRSHRCGCWHAHSCSLCILPWNSDFCYYQENIYNLPLLLGAFSDGNAITQRSKKPACSNIKILKKRNSRRKLFVANDNSHSEWWRLFNFSVKRRFAAVKSFDEMLLRIVGSECFSHYNGEL